MKLYIFEPGPFPRRVLIFMALKNIRHIELCPLDVYAGEARTPAFLKMNPGGGVPLLEIGDGQFVYESQAILQYLEELYPEPPMRGRSEAERQRVDVQAGLINEFYHHCFLSSAHLSPYVSRIVAQCHELDMVTGPLWRMRLEQIAQVMGSSRFLAGERPTIPDCMLFPMLEYIRQVYDICIPSHLKPLHRWFDDFRNLPGIPLLKLPPTYVEDTIARFGARV